MVMVFDPARLLAQFFGGLQANLVLLDRVRGLFHQTPTIADHAEAVAAFDTRADITLDKVRRCQAAWGAAIRRVGASADALAAAKAPSSSSPPRRALRRGAPRPTT